MCRPVPRHGQSQDMSVFYAIGYSHLRMSYLYSAAIIDDTALLLLLGSLAARSLAEQKLMLNGDDVSEPDTQHCYREENGPRRRVRHTNRTDKIIFAKICTAQDR